MCSPELATAYRLGEIGDVERVLVALRGLPDKSERSAAEAVAAEA